MTTWLYLINYNQYNKTLIYISVRHARQQNCIVIICVRSVRVYDELTSDRWLLVQHGNVLKLNNSLTCLPTPKDKHTNVNELRIILFVYRIESIFIHTYVYLQLQLSYLSSARVWVCLFVYSYIYVFYLRKVKGHHTPPPTSLGSLVGNRRFGDGVSAGLQNLKWT